MPAQLQPNRLVVNDRFPMLGFTIRTDGTPQRAEITIATNPTLFNDPTQRTSSNFFSTSELGPLSVPKGEAVYVVPLEILARFVSAQRLYFGLATAPAENGSALQVQIKPTEDSPYVSISGLSGRGLRQVRLFPHRNQRPVQGSNGGSEYGGQGGNDLRWAGDVPGPGMQSVPPKGVNGSTEPVQTANGVRPNNGNGNVDVNGSNRNLGNGHSANSNGNSNNTPEPIDYDDGFGPMPPVPTTDSPPPFQNNIQQQPAPTAQALDLNLSNIQIGETSAAQPPAVTHLSTAQSIAIQAALALNPALTPLVASARAAAELGNVSVGIGPAVSGGVLAGAQLGAGLIFAPGNRLGAYGSYEDIAGLIASISLTAQVTVLRGGIESFEGISYTAGISVGEGVVGGGSVIFDSQRRFLGVSFNLGVGAGLSPFEIFTSVQRSVATQLGYATAFSLDLGDIQIGEPTPAQAPTATGLGSVESAALLAALALNPALNPLVAITRAAVELGNVSVGVGPAVSGGLGAGLQLSAGLIFAPGNRLGVYGSYEEIAGLIASISLTAQVTVLRGGIESFEGIAYTAGISGGEGIIGGGSVIFDSQQRFLGVSLNLGIGAGLSPFEIFTSVQRSVATQLGVTATHGLAQGTALNAAPFAVGGKTFGINENFTLNWDEVQAVPQPTDVSCWAAAGAMVIGWRDRMSLSPETIAEISGRTTASGLDPRQVRDFANDLGLNYEQPMCYTQEGFRQLLEENGPLWVAASVPGLHAIVVTGIYNQGNQLFVRITDPWDRATGTPGAPGSYASTHTTGSRYILRWEDFVAEYEEAATDYSGVHLQILHSGRTQSRQPNRGQPSPPPGYAQAHMKPNAMALGGETQALGINENFTLNWDEVQAVPQPTDVSCWAAAGAMVIGWRDRMSLSPETIAEISGRTTASGLDPRQVRDFANDLGLNYEQPMCYTQEGFRQLVEDNGPLWVTASVPGLHAIVVTGLYNQGNQLYVRVTDPWDRAVGTPGAPGSYANSHSTGSRYILRWEDFVAEYEEAATDYSGVHLQILHSGGTQSRQPNRGQPSPPPGYAQAYSSSKSQQQFMPGQAYRQPASHTFNEPGTSPQNGIGNSPANQLPGQVPNQPVGAFPPSGVNIFRSRNQIGGVDYDLFLMDGPVPPQIEPQVVQNLTPGEQILVTDWPYIDGPAGRTKGGVAIDWSYAAGTIANVRVSPAGGQAYDGWQVLVNTDIGPGPSTPTETKLKVTIRTTFRSAGQADQVGISEITLGGSGRYETTHREEVQAAEPVAA